MFGIGTTEILVILVVALIVIGPSKLPEMARTLGKALGEFKRMSSDVKRTIDLEAQRAEKEAPISEEPQEIASNKKDAGKDGMSEASPAQTEDSREDDNCGQGDAEDKSQKAQTAASDVSSREA